VLNNRSFPRTFRFLWCSYPHVDFKNRFNPRRRFERVSTRIESAVGSLDFSFNFLPVSSTFHKLLRLLATLFDLSPPSPTFFDLRIRRIPSTSSSTFFELSRTSSTLPERIRTASPFFKLLRLSNRRDFGNLRASTGRFLHKASWISSVVPQDSVSGLWLGEEEKRRRGWGQVNGRAKKKWE
jgi:hypothetical protein